MVQRRNGVSLVVNARLKWLYAIYEDMTGTVPPESFWNTPAGVGIAGNNPAYLYDQPTCNLDEIIRDLPEKDRKEVFRLIRVHNKDNMDELEPFIRRKAGENEEEALFYAVLTRSALRVPPSERIRETRYRHSSEPEKKEAYLNALTRYEKRRNQIFRFSLLRRHRDFCREKNQRKNLERMQK